MPDGSQVRLYHNKRLSLDQFWALANFVADNPGSQNSPRARSYGGQRYYRWATDVKGPDTHSSTLRWAPGTLTVSLEPGDGPVVRNR